MGYVKQGLIILVFYLLGVANGRTWRQKEPSLNFVGEGTNDLSISILQSEGENKTNLVFSPLGYSAILAILAEGARANTRNQLVVALKLPEDTYAVRNTYKNVLSSMQERGIVNQPEFKNWFYVYKNYTVLQAYKNILRDNYLTNVKEIEIDYYDNQEFLTEKKDKKPITEKTEIIEDIEKTEKPDIVLNSTPEPIILDKTPEPIVLDKTPEPIVLDKTPEPIVLDKTPEPIVLNETPEPILNATPEPIIFNETEKPKIVKEETEKSIIEQQTEKIVVNKEKEEIKIEENETSLEEKIARAIKSELQVEKEMLTALSANRLSTVQETGSGDSKSTSRMIIFNALYFRGNWSVPFTADKEKLNTFYTSETEKKQVKFISSEGEFECGRISELDATAIELPYQGGRYSLLIIVPDSREGISKLTSKLSGYSFKDIGKNLSKKLVKVCIPAFKFYSITRPKKALVKCGVSDIFNEAADLSGITGYKGLYLDDLVQLVTLEVNENSGTTNFLTSSAVESLRDVNGPEKFSADRPFLFFLRDRVDNLIVVSGKVHEPTTPEEEEV